VPLRRRHPPLKRGSGGQAPLHVPAAVGFPECPRDPSPDPETRVGPKPRAHALGQADERRLASQRRRPDGAQLAHHLPAYRRDLKLRLGAKPPRVGRDRAQRVLDLSSVEQLLPEPRLVERHQSVRHRAKRSGLLRRRLAGREVAGPASVKRAAGVARDGGAA
jgi:hypothetical protein